GGRLKRRGERGTARRGSAKADNRLVPVLSEAGVLFQDSRLHPAVAAAIDDQHIIFKLGVVGNSLHYACPPACGPSSTCLATLNVQAHGGGHLPEKPLGEYLLSFPLHENRQPIHG